MLITPVLFAELPQLLLFAEHTFRVAFEHDNNPTDFKIYCDEAFTPHQFQEEWSNTQSKFFFGRIDDQVVAYLKLNFDKQPHELDGQQTVQVERLYVAPNRQGQGLGVQMLNFAYQEAQNIGANWIWLSVWQVNPPALRFYERCGYEVFGTETFQIGNDPQIDWLVKKPVS